MWQTGCFIKSFGMPTLARSGKQALQILQQPQGFKALEMSKEKVYDLILMDVPMPELDGFEATKVIRKRSGKQSVIVALTVNTMKADKEEFLDVWDG